MSSWTTPVTDRTLSDVLNKASKGYMNLTDWQRIYGNCDYLKDLIDAYTGGSVSFTSVPAKTMTSIPDVDMINALAGNLNNLRNEINFTALSLLSDGWEGGFLVEAPDYTDVNQWETFTLALYEAVENLKDYAIPCGVAAAGQSRMWQNRFRRS